MKVTLSTPFFFLLCCPTIPHAQAPTPVVNGYVVDTSGVVVPNATVAIINDATQVRYATGTNGEEIYSVPNLLAGTYDNQVSKVGSKSIVHPDILFYVQDAMAIGFTLLAEPTSDAGTVEGGVPVVNTETATLGTVDHPTNWRRSLSRTLRAHAPPTAFSTFVIIQQVPIPDRNSYNCKISTESKRGSRQLVQLDQTDQSSGSQSAVQIAKRTLSELDELVVRFAFSLILISTLWVLVKAHWKW